MTWWNVFEAERRMHESDYVLSLTFVRLHDAGYSYRQIAVYFGVSHEYVRMKCQRIVDSRPAR